MADVSIVFDIGGTNMRIAACRESVLGEAKKIPTPQNPKEAIAQLVALAKEMAGGEKIDAVAGCIRGTIVDGVFRKDKRLPEWEGTKLADEISLAIGAETTIAHDTAAVGLGEVHHGAGRGSRVCAYVTVSTGVGGDRIVDGHLDHGTYNPEIGRQLIQGEELEDLISGEAVKKKFGIEPKDLADIEERNKLADILAIGLYNSALHWTPDTIVLGGSMIVGVNPIPIPRVVEMLSKYLTMYPKVPEIKMAELGDFGGLHGAMVLALQK